MQQRFFKILAGCAIIASCLIACNNPENEAREMLNQGLLMKQDGKIVEAEETFKKIAAQYAKTKVATEALKELEQMQLEKNISNLFSPKMSESRQKAITKAQKAATDTEQTMAKIIISLIETALDTYRLDVGKFPTTDQGLAALREKPDDGDEWDGPYLSKELPLDPWGQDYIYISPLKNNDYVIISYGADGNPSSTTIF